MMTTKYYTIGVTICVLLTAYPAICAEKPRWGHNVGYKFATVARPDNNKGLSVRAGPGSSEPRLALITRGTPLELHNRYEKGWALLKQPFGKGWVDMRGLKKLSVKAKVIDSSGSRDCAALRNGPAASFKELACIGLREEVVLDGIWTEGGWAMVVSPRKGWIDSGLINPDLTALNRVARPGRSMGEAPQPVRERRYRRRKQVESEAQRLMNEPLFDSESSQKMQQWLMEEADRRMEWDFRNIR
jgi:hypothetical protein